MRGEIPAAPRTALENCRSPQCASLNEGDGWLRRPARSSIASCLRGYRSPVKGELSVERLHTYASVGRIATAVGAFIALCVRATKVARRY